MIPLKKYLESLMAYAQKNMQFSHPPKWELDNSEDEGVFRKTAHYNPGNETITIFTLNRHPKDILRSFSHELVHHTQNLRGDLSPEKCGDLSLGYAQNNKHMRDMESEAYLKGNLCFRDWEDICKKRLGESIIKNYKEKKLMNRNKLEGLIRKLVKERVNSKKETIKESMELSDQTREAVTSAILDAMRGLDQTTKGEVIADLQRAAVDDEESDESTAEMPTPTGDEEVVAAAPEEKEEVAEGGCGKGGRAHKKDEENIMDENEEIELEEEKKDCEHCEGTGKVKGKDCEHCKKVSENEEPDLEEAKKKKKKSKKKKPDADRDGVPDWADKKPGEDDHAGKKKRKKKVAESKIQTPEQENLLYESRFGRRNQKIFDKLTELWTK